jgi:hypothetical protein
LRNPTINKIKEIMDTKNELFIRSIYKYSHLGVSHGNAQKEEDVLARDLFQYFNTSYLHDALNIFINKDRMDLLEKVVKRISVE